MTLHGYKAGESQDNSQANTLAVGIEHSHGVVQFIDQGLHQSKGQQTEP